jgi:hypothetical protein
MKGKIGDVCVDLLLSFNSLGEELKGSPPKGLNNRGLNMIDSILTYNIRRASL